MIRFAGFSCFEIDECFRLSISLSITVTFLADFSKKDKASRILAGKDKWSIKYSFPDPRQSFKQSYFIFYI